MSLDSEFLPDGTLLCISISSKAGTGVLIFADDADAMGIVKTVVENPKVTVTMHSAVADVDKLWQVGIKPQVIQDTLYELYWRNMSPLGLKVQSRRLLGVAMEEYEDVIRKAQQDAGIEYLRRAIYGDWEISASTCEYCEGQGGFQWMSEHDVEGERCPDCKGSGEGQYKTPQVFIKIPLKLLYPDPEPFLEMVTRTEKRRTLKFPKAKVIIGSEWPLKPRWYVHTSKGKMTLGKKTWKKRRGRIKKIYGYEGSPIATEPTHPLYRVKLSILVQEAGGIDFKTKQPKNISSLAEVILKAKAREFEVDEDGEYGAVIDVIYRWNQIDQGQRDVVEDAIGVIPEVGLDKVPLAEWGMYAARDADVTIRLSEYFERHPLGGN